MASQAFDVHSSEKRRLRTAKHELAGIGIQLLR